ncbi:MAG: TRAP transporter permease, partial [Alloalcanivorax xenomutans]
GEWSKILLSTITAITAIWLLASAMEGYLYRAGLLSMIQRVVLIVAGALLIYPEPISDVVGFGLLALVYLSRRLFKPVAAVSSRES